MFRFIIIGIVEMLLSLSQRSPTPQQKKPAEGRFFLLWCRASAFTVRHKSKNVPPDKNHSRMKKHLPGELTSQYLLSMAISDSNPAFGLGSNDKMSPDKNRSHIEKHLQGQFSC